MAEPSSYRPAPGEIPTDPGVYRFRDADGRVIYVGKAKNLRNRLNSYFASPETLRPKTYAMVHTAASVEWTVVASEMESLQLEYTWIKEYAPRFNIAFRDDKSYPYLAVTVNDVYPRAMVTRGERRKGVRYFGPYSQVWAIRETLDALLTVFPVRTCTNGVFQRAKNSGRPCLLGYIDKCSAPCVGKISAEDHRELARGLTRFMGGGAEKYIERLTKEMKEAAAQMDFERAAVLRDDIAALTKAFERNAVVLGSTVDADLFAYVEDDLEASVQVFFVRGGRIRGQRGWIVEKVDDSTDAQLIEQLLTRVYSDIAVSLATQKGSGAESLNSYDIPRSVLVPVEPENKEQLASWLSEVRGGPVEITVPQRGDKAELMKTVTENARQALTLHKSRRAGDLTTRSASLVELQTALELPDPLLRIECYDISHVQGTNVVASMVVFEDGMPRKDAYRTFNIRGTDGNGTPDDTSAMNEVLTRRFSRLLAEEAGIEGEDEDGVAYASGPIEATTGRPRRFSYRPDLVVVDGGLPQVNAARAALEAVGADVPVVGLAKRLEEVWIPGDEFPLILPRTSEALYLLQYLRDESHRFAITKHRGRRSRASRRSVLDSIPGLGPARQAALLKHFGSVKRLREATPDQIAHVKGVGVLLARQIHDRLHTSSREEMP